MIVELHGAKWHGCPSAIGAYINGKQAEQPQRTRSRITKEHNYKFTHRRAVQVDGGQWRAKTAEL